MSAYDVGAKASTKDTTGALQSTGPKSSAPSAFVKWVPGEAITFYAAILGLGAAQGTLTGDETPDELLERIDAASPEWFLVGAALAAILVILGAITAADKPEGSRWSPASLAARTVLTLISFVIWTTALPGAWPYGWHFIRDMGSAYALLLVPVAAIFASIAELATRRYNL